MRGGPQGPHPPAPLLSALIEASLSQASCFLKSCTSVRTLSQVFTHPFTPVSLQPQVIEQNLICSHPISRECLHAVSSVTRIPSRVLAHILSSSHAFSNIQYQMLAHNRNHLQTFASILSTDFAQILRCSRSFLTHTFSCARTHSLLEILEFASLPPLPHPFLPLCRRDWTRRQHSTPLCPLFSRTSRRSSRARSRTLA